MQKTALILFVLGVAFCQQPAPVKCPYGARFCSVEGGKIKVFGCYHSYQYTKSNGDQECATTVDMSKTSVMIYDQSIYDESLNYISFCNLSYNLVGYSNEHSFCTKCQIKGAGLCFELIDPPQINRIVVFGCLDGYPSRDSSSCILRNESAKIKSLSNIAQQVDPLPNCYLGVRPKDSEQLTCWMCKEGYVATGKEPDIKCIPKTTQPEGCLYVDNQGKCATCNYLYGWLPIDDQATSCYKFDPNHLEKLSQPLY